LPHHRRRAEHLPGPLSLMLCIGGPLLRKVAAQVALGFLEASRTGEGKEMEA
jgi:hypothetical protein